MFDILAQAPNRASQLAKTLPYECWHPRALAFLKAHLQQPWAIACSGGADSVALLLLCWAYWPQQRSRLTVLHYNHALRAEASEADARFVAYLARALGVHYIQERSQHDSGSLFSEAALREARYAFLEASMRRLDAHVLLLGHQADDVAETLFMRLARGSGLEGLVGPRPLTQIGDLWRVRPLINIPKKTLQCALRAVDMGWREDASNAQQQYLRNRVRQAMPAAMETAFGGHWLSGFSASRELLEEDANALDAWASMVMTHYRKGQPLDWRPIAHAPRAVQRRVLYRWIGDCGLALEKASFESILTNLNTGAEGSWNVAAQRHLIFSRGQISLEDELDEAMLWASAQIQPQPLNSGDIFELPSRATIEARLLESHSWEESITPDPFITYIAVEPAISVLSVRFWRPGDRYQPLGADAAKKLQDIFMDAKVPKRIRHQLPCVMHPDGQILWIPGLRRSEKSRLQEGFRPWKLTYRPPA